MQKGHPVLKEQEKVVHLFPVATKWSLCLQPQFINECRSPLGINGAHSGTRIPPLEMLTEQSVVPLN